MKQTSSALFGLLAAFLSIVQFLPSASAQINFSSGSPYTQNFDSLANSGTANAWTDNSTLPGWYASKVSSGAITTYRAGTGAENTGALYSYGASGATERALGSLASGTPGNIAYGVRFANDTANTITNLTISYTGEQWRNGGNTSVQKLAFSYLVSSSAITSSDAVNANSWTAFTDLDFNSPVTGSTAAALDGNSAPNRQIFSDVVLPVAVFPGQEIFLRWYDINDSGNDHALALDDLTMTFTSIAPVIDPPNIPAAGQPQSRTNNAGTSAIFTVNATGSALSYQWAKDSGDLSDNVRIFGSASRTLTVSNITAVDAGAYSVRVYNTANSVTSADAILTVIDPAINSQPLSLTNLFGDNANFFVGTAGISPMTYQWRLNGNDIQGATAATLNIPATNEADFSVVVVNNDFTPASITSAPAHLTLLATPATQLVRWDFNATNTFPAAAPTPSSGSGSASIVGLGAGSFAAGCYSDPAVGLGADNAGWNTLNYAAQGTSNKLTGVQFNVSTLGFQDLFLVWEQRHSDTASKYTRLQYTSDGVNFVDGPLITMNVSGSFVFYTASLAGIAALNNNPSFGFRIVSEFESSALGTTNENYVATATSYNSGGTIRLDLMTLFGNPFSGVAPIPLQIRQDGTNVILTWSNPAFSLASSTDLAACTNKIPGATSPYTNPIAGDKRFFRLVYP